MSPTEPYLTFEAGGHSLALPGSRVIEIKRHEDAAGVALVDVSCVLSGRPVEVGPRTCVIVVSLDAPSVGATCGLVVDSATDITMFGSGDLVAAPDFGPHVNLSYLSALARRGESYIVVLDIDQFCSSLSEPAEAV